jgi:type II secretory pathway pseudopilin PulG
MQKRKSNSDGFTLITTLLLLFLLSGLAIGMLMMVNTEVKVGTQDVQNNLTFHAAEGAIENMTAQLSTVLTNNLAPTINQITSLDNVPGPPAIPGITFPPGSYTLSPVLNAAGNFIKADLASVTAAASEASKSMPDDFRVSITNPPGANAYPISSFTWLLIPSRITDPQKKKILIDFLGWMLTTGQDFAEPLSYSRLPRDVIAKETQAIARIE